MPGEQQHGHARKRVQDAVALALLDLVAGAACRSERPLRELNQPDLVERFVRAPLHGRDGMILALHEQGVIGERLAAGERYTTRFLEVVGQQ